MIDSEAFINNAPVDDEPLMAEEECAVTASKEWLKQNQGIPLEEVVATLGLSMEQIRGHK